MTTPLPIIAPFAQGVDSTNTPYTLYTSPTHLQIADEGGWITPVTAVNHGNGTFSFTTISPHLLPWQQVTSAPLKGSFSAPLEVENLFIIDPSSWAALIAFDNTLANNLNEKLGLVANFGFVEKISESSIPSFDSSVTTTSFFTAYYAETLNPTLQFLQLLQVFTWAANPATYSADLINGLMPTFLHFKTNLYNLNRQIFLF
jgi:hypothetical protein